MSKHERFMISGKPFFALGAQAHNASGYAMKDLDRAFEAVQFFGGNSLAIPVYWEQVEPVEGEYDCTMVTEIIERARKEGLKIVFLWFGTWKNGTMKYAPVWVKKNKARFPRVTLPSGFDTTVLSAHGMETRAADSRAFAQVMAAVKAADPEQDTVLGMQVENEPGIMGGAIRDWSELGNAAMAEAVPEGLVEFIRARGCGDLYDIWQANGAKVGADWDTTFGDHGSECMNAYATASYINAVVEAGKAVYDIFMYTNVWLDNQGWNVPGFNYPSGGAVARTLDIWKYAGPALDLIAPDIYHPDKEEYERAMRIYDRDDNALYIPESACDGEYNIRGIFHAIADHNSIGHHVFGVETMVDNDGYLRDAMIPMVKSLSMVNDILPLILKYQGTGRIHAITQNEGQTHGYYEFGDWMCQVEFGKRTDGWNQMDYLHLDDVGEPGDCGRGLIIQVADNEFYLVGDGLRLFFHRKVHGGHLSPILTTEFLLQRSVNYATLTEGYFDEDDNYVIERYRSGDENDFGVWTCYDVGVIHFELTD